MFDTMEDVENFILGSKNMDRMKSEIHQTINSLVGLVKSQLKPTDMELVGDTLSERSKRIIPVRRRAWKFSAASKGNSSWELEAIHTEEELKFYVSCIIPVGEFASISLNQDLMTRNMGDIEKIYDALPSFLRGMTENFPGIIPELENLSKAAKKF